MHVNMNPETVLEAVRNSAQFSYRNVDSLPLKSCEKFLNPCNIACRKGEGVEVTISLLQGGLQSLVV
jgi:hypothetical protein